jgi:hypothetical protein
MKAFVTSIGEPTTDLCVWSLERNGFEVVLLNNGSLLADKLKSIYEQATDDFVRIDADVVVNSTFTPETALSRLEEFYNPRRFESPTAVAGLHGFALGDHLDRVYRQKEKREYFNTYDFELLTKLEGLLK